MTHTFDIVEAKEHGLVAAVVLNMLRFWIDHNRANGKNLIDGHTWTYNSVKAWTELAPYLTPKQVRTAIDNLVEKGILLKGKFNENAYDHTLWYAFAAADKPIGPEGQPDVPEKADRFALQGKRLEAVGEPVVEPNPSKQENELIAPPAESKTPLQIEADKFVDWFLTLLAETNAKITLPTPSERAGWAATYEKLRRIDGKQKEEIVAVCRWARTGWWANAFFSPCKLREKNGGVSRYDEWCSRMNNPVGSGQPKKASFA